MRWRWRSRERNEVEVKEGAGRGGRWDGWNGESRLAGPANRCTSAHTGLTGWWLKDSSTTFLDWMLTSELINIQLHISSPCMLPRSWKGFDSRIVLSLQAQYNYQVLWADRSARGSIDTCVSWRTALDSVSLTSQWKKRNVCLKSVTRMVCVVEDSARTELLLRLGCSNQNRLKKHLQRWCLWRNHAGLVDPSTHPLQQQGLSVRVRTAREVSELDGFSEAAWRYQRLKVSAELHE